MPPPADRSRRQALLDAVIDTAAADGIGGRSLRDLAAAAGTSHRMLLHYFGSRDELLVAIVEEVERRQTATLPELPDDPAAALLASWADLARPDLRPFERLFFECYARGAQGEAPFDRLLPSAIDGWLDAMAADAERRGADFDPVHARLSLAVIRGLLLDLVATDDRDGTEAALVAFARLSQPGPRRESALRASSTIDDNTSATGSTERT